MVRAENPTQFIRSGAVSGTSPGDGHTAALIRILIVRVSFIEAISAENEKWPRDRSLRDVRRDIAYVMRAVLLGHVREF